MIKKISLFFAYMVQVFAAGWTIVGDTFTNPKGSCEFDIWLNASQQSQNLGFYGDCVILQHTSMQLASNASTQSSGNKGFIEIEQEFFTSNDHFFNIGLIGGNIINTISSYRDYHFYTYVPISFNWFGERMRTTLNIGWSYQSNAKQNLLTLSSSISGYITQKFWLVAEVSTSNTPKILLDSSFYQIGASYFIQNNISLDIAYLNALNHKNFGTIIFGIAFSGKFFD